MPAKKGMGGSRGGGIVLEWKGKGKLSKNRTIFPLGGRLCKRQKELFGVKGGCNEGKEKSKRKTKRHCLTPGMGQKLTALVGGEPGGGGTR